MNNSSRVYFRHILFIYEISFFCPEIKHSNRNKRFDQQSDKCDYTVSRWINTGDRLLYRLITDDWLQTGF